MTVHENSVEAYRDLIEEGVLSEQRAMALHFVNIMQPVTARMIDIKLGGGTFPPRSIQPCLTWLKQAGSIKEAFHEQCPITGRKAAWYEATGEPPRPPMKYKMTRERARDMIEVLREAWTALPEHRGKIEYMAKHLKSKYELGGEL